MAKINKGDFLPQTVVSHPKSTLKDVARWLEIEALYYRKSKNRDGEFTLQCVARKLRKIAAGESPFVAFLWLAEQPKGSAK